MKTAAAYIRVSTDDQTEYSPESQRKAVIAYAKQHDMIIPEEFIFTDEGISGRTVKRPAFQKMIGTAKLKPAPFDVILVWKFSRFARNREDSIVYKSMLRKQCGIDVISVSEQLSEDKTSVLIEALLEAMDEYYSINLAEEVVRGMTEKAHRGGVMGSQPFGYRAENGKILIDEEQAQIVRSIFADFNNGIPMRKIANALNDSGIRTKFGNLWDNRGIEYLLRNVAYLGKSHWTPEAVKSTHAEKLSEKTIITDSHEAIISEEEFAQAQERIAELKRTHIYKSHPQHGKPFMLKGLCRCSSCGATLVRSSDSGLQCHRYTTGKCTVSHYISFPNINRMVIEKLQEDFENPSFDISAFLKQQTAVKPDTKAQEAQLGKLRQQLKRIKEAYAAGVDTLEEYKENKIRIQNQINAVQETIQKIPVQTITAEELSAQLKTAIQSALIIADSDSSEELKNEVLRTLIQKIIFDRKTSQVVIFYQF